MSDFEIGSMSGGPFETNAYIIIDNATKHCAIIDPGYDADKSWGGYITENGLTLKAIWLTHGHIDHVTGVEVLHRAYPEAEILIHEDDVPQLSGPMNTAVAKNYGLPEYIPVEATGRLREGENVKIGETEFQVFFTPGHSPGHVVLLNGEQLIGGDVIFQGSIGRTDLPGANYATLANSIVEKIMVLPDETAIYPGHGPATTVGAERQSNPFVREMLANVSD